MQKLSFFIVALFLFSCGSEISYRFEIQNAYDSDVHELGMSFTMKDMLKNFRIPVGQWPVVMYKGEYLPSQVDDLDDDGKWDELFFLVDMKAGETKEVEVRFLDPADFPVFETRTNLRFARKDKGYEEVEYAIREQHAINTKTQEVWQMEGIAWENDHIGFRNYFDQRNGNDIFGKVTTDMVLDEVGYKDHPGYHEFNPEWGMDVLKVGNSLGAGSIAFSYKDSLYRVGDNGLGTCRVLCEGPLRSIFRFKFENWEMGDQLLHVTQDIMIRAGTDYYESRVFYSGTDEPVELVIGIVNMKCDDLLHEADVGDQYRAFYTLAPQAEDTTYLGMGIKIPAEDFIGTSKAPDEGNGIIETNCIHTKIESGDPSSYKFYAVWEVQDEKWRDPKIFREVLAEVK